MAGDGSADRPGIGRRRVIWVGATMAAAAPLLPWLLPTDAPGVTAADAASVTEPPVTWRGTALGADAALSLGGGDPARARSAIRQCLAEVERLEAEFSLLDARSAIVRLNRDGVLDRPSLDFRAILAAADRVWAASAGAFDVTVQPLWRLYAGHFARHPDDRAGPPAAAIAAACRHVDQGRIDVRPARIRLAPKAALTLNGIAQGYITDRVARLLQDQGWPHVLVAMGEIRAVGGHPQGGGWRIALPAAPPLDVGDGAVATSAGAGTRFEPSGRHHHLFQPATGGSAGDLAQATVLAADATLADALATALYVMPAADRAACLAHFPGTAAILVAADGSRRRLGGA